MLSMIAMSGGVDSSVAAALTADARGGDACAGVAMRLYSTADDAPRTGRTCCAPDDLYDARRAAAAIGVRFYVYDAQERFRERVIEPFVAAYARGETPNPCVRCNDHVKFDWLLDRARKLGATELVTGHYARVERRAGRWRLLRAADAAKDQSYFLHGLTQEALEFVRFPLGQRTKTQVRALARERGLPNADKAESMEVCFVGATPLAEFLEGHGVQRQPGEIVDGTGRVLGAHAGVHRFTVGQRRGIGSGFKLPLYVGSIDAASRRVIVGTREEVGRRDFHALHASWVESAPAAGTRCEVQIRHRGKPLPAILDPSGPEVEVKLLEPAIGVAPGQSAIFYQGDEVLGGATICR
ncbi:MAG: tRNA 2-thiouridine(34) synthase MnmA [Myxococcales bacterium]